MAERNMVTVGQIFTLLLISRLSLTVIYSVYLSGMESLWDLLIPLLLSMALSILLLMPVDLLYGRNRKRSVCGIAVQRWGAVGCIIAVLYGIYFWGSCVYAMMGLKYFLNVLLPEGIQAKAVAMVLTGACIYAALKGIEALSRMAAVVLGLVILSAVLLMVYLMPGFSSEELLPSGYMTFAAMTDGTVLILSRMNTTAALNVLLPHSKGRLWKSSVLWSVWLFLLMIFMLVLFRGALGEYPDARELPVYQSIEGAGSLQRLNPFFIFVSMCSIFCNVSVLLFSVSESIKVIFRDSFGKTITVLSGVILAGIVLFVPENEMIFDKYIWCIMTVVFTFVIPLAVYIAIRVPKKKKRIVKRVIRTASMTILLSVVMLSGCNSTQLNERIIVQGIGIDRDQDNYAITLIVLDTENEEKENAVSLMYTDGATVDEALGTLENQRGKRLLLSQCLFIMMDEEAAKRYDETLSYFADLKEMQKTANLMMTKESAKKTIISGIEKFGYHSENINVLADSRAVEQTEVHCSLSDYISSRKENGTAMVFPCIVIREEIRSLSVSGSNAADRNGSFYHMTEDETLGMLTVNQQVNNFTDTVSVNGSQKSYRIEHIHTHIIPQWKESYLDISFDIEADVDKEYESQTMQAITERIRANVESAIRKALFENGSDVFSLAKNIGEFRWEKSSLKDILQSSVTHIKVICV